jgi:hypothetical protein
MSQVNFGTPIHREGSGFMNAIESYIGFGDKKIEVVCTYADSIEDKDITVGVEVDRGSTQTALRVASMVLTCGILPLLALIIKAFARAFSDSVHITDTEVENALLIGLRNDSKTYLEIMNPLADQIFAACQAEEKELDKIPGIDAALVAKAKAHSLFKPALSADVLMILNNGLLDPFRTKLAAYAEECPLFEDKFNNLLGIQ